MFWCLSTAAHQHILYNTLNLIIRHLCITFIPINLRFPRPRCVCTVTPYMYRQNPRKVGGVVYITARIFISRLASLDRYSGYEPSARPSLTPAVTSEVQRLYCTFLLTMQSLDPEASSAVSRPGQRRCKRTHEEGALDESYLA
jgi:hypothetical protein